MTPLNRKRITRLAVIEIDSGVLQILRMPLQQRLDGTKSHL